MGGILLDCSGATEETGVLVWRLTTGACSWARSTNSDLQSGESTDWQIILGEGGVGGRDAKGEGNGEEGGAIMVVAMEKGSCVIASSFRFINFISRKFANRI